MSDAHDPVLFMVTSVGLNALIEAQGGTSSPIKIGALGVTQSAFVMAPTITSVPGEFKRITAVSGQASSDTVIHMTAQDVSTDVYDLRGMGLYLEDGRLFAIYSQSTPIFRKVDIAFFLIALDIAFGNGVAGDISFGDTSFLMPPASETVKGVAEIATPEEAAAGVDHQRIITPKTAKILNDAVALFAANALAAVNTAIRADLVFGDNHLAGMIAALDTDLTGDIGALDVRLTNAIAALAAETDADLSALSNAFDAIIAALVARTITGGGLVTGGGNLTQSRILSVARASVQDVVDGVADDCAITPWSLAGFQKYLGQNGYLVLPGGGGLMLQWGRLTAASNASTATTFPLAFPNACLAVVPGGGVSGGADSQDNPPVLVESTITRFGFSVFSADDSAAGMRFIAVGN